MANVGDIEYKYRRNYILVNPDPSLGPPTWRVSSPQEIGTPGTGGGGTGGTVYDFDGVAPVDVDMTPGLGPNPTVVSTSLDFVQLDRRDA